jgi:ubiquitin-like 1-activating enzyme E1 B
LFGNAEEEDLQTDESEENAEEIKALGRETEELKAIKDAMGSSDYARKVFEKVYNVDIDRLLSMESMWKNRKKPSPLDFDALESQMDDQEDGKDSLPDQKVWTLKESFEQFKSR